MNAHSFGQGSQECAVHWPVHLSTGLLPLPVRGLALRSSYLWGRAPAFGSPHCSRVGSCLPTVVFFLISKELSSSLAAPGYSIPSSLGKILATFFRRERRLLRRLSEARVAYLVWRRLYPARGAHLYEVASSWYAPPVIVGRLNESPLRLPPFGIHHSRQPRGAGTPEQTRANPHITNSYPNNLRINILFFLLASTKSIRTPIHILVIRFSIPGLLPSGRRSVLIPKYKGRKGLSKGG